MPEAGSDTYSFEHEINIVYSAVLSPRMLNQLRFLVDKADNRVESITTLSQTIVSGAFTGCGAQASQHYTENHFDGTDLLTNTQGKHEMKFGTDVPDISRRTFDDYANAQGTYTFASLADYVISKPSLYVVQQGQPRVTFGREGRRWICGRHRAAAAQSVRFRRHGIRYYLQSFFNDDPNSRAPRLSFAYAPSTRGHIILPGGAGLFYDHSGPQPHF